MVRQVQILGEIEHPFHEHLVAFDVAEHALREELVREAAREAVAAEAKPAVRILRETLP